MRSVSSVVVVLAIAAMAFFASPACADIIFQDTFDAQAVGANLETLTPPIGGGSYSSSNVGVITGTSDGKYVVPRTLLEGVPYSDRLHISAANQTAITNQQVAFGLDFYISAGGGGGPSFSSRSADLSEIGWDIKVDPDGSVEKLSGGAWATAGISAVRTGQWIPISVVADYAAGTYTATVDGKTFSGAFHTAGVHSFDNLLIAPSDIGTFYAYDNVSISTVPEPSAMALFLAGLCGLLAYAWRTRK